MYDDPLTVDRSRVQDTGGGFVLYDEHTGESIFALPCWRCGRNEKVDALDWHRCSHVTCATCAKEIKTNR